MRSVAIPKFPTSDSNELNTLLAKLRSDHIMPSFLTQIQRRLVYRKKNVQLLEHTDSTIVRGGETLELRPLNQQALQAERKQIVPEAVRLIVELDQWAQLIPLLESNDVKKCPLLSAGEVRDLLQRAIVAGKFNIVLECLRASNRTRLSLHDPAILRIALRGPRSTAEHGKWQGRSVKAAAKQMEQVIVMLRQAYRGKSLPQGLSWPSTLALPLEVHAAAALDGTSTVLDAQGKVEMYHNALLSQFESGSPTMPLDPLEQLSLYHGIALASRAIEGSSLAAHPAQTRLQQFAQDCGVALAKRRETIRARVEAGEATESQMRLVKEIDCATARVEKVQAQK